MKKILIFPVLFLLAVMLVVTSSCGKKPSTTKTQDQIDSTKKDAVKNDDGSKKNFADSSLTVGYMYWVPPAILDEHWAAVITGEVVNIESGIKKAGDSTKKEVFGVVKVDKVLLSEPTEKMSMENQKYVRTDALKGFKPGDKVLIYFVKYEKGYAIKRDNVKKISGPDDELLGLTERYIKNSQNTEMILKDLKEYKMWGKYDVGTASRLMQEYEEKTKGETVK